MKRFGYLMEANWKCSEDAQSVARHLGAFEEFPDPEEAIGAAQILIQAARKGDQQLFHELARMVGVARGSGNPASLEAVMDLLRDTRAEHLEIVGAAIDRNAQPGDPTVVLLPMEDEHVREAAEMDPQ